MQHPYHTRVHGCLAPLLRIRFRVDMSSTESCLVSTRGKGWKNGNGTVKSSSLFASFPSQSSTTHIPAFCLLEVWLPLRLRNPNHPTMSDTIVRNTKDLLPSRIIIPAGQNGLVLIVLALCVLTINVYNHPNSYLQTCLTTIRDIYKNVGCTRSLQLGPKQTLAVERLLCVCDLMVEVLSSPTDLATVAADFLAKYSNKARRDCVLSDTLSLYDVGSPQPLSERSPFCFTNTFDTLN